jgi:uncharacterized protein YbjT (DUF2867 family)
MNADILLLGGTGHLGRDLIKTLTLAGVSIRVGSRRPRPAGTDHRIDWAQIDLATGKGVSEAARGVDAIVFAAGDPKQHAAVEFEGMRGLLQAAKSSRVQHFLFVSIVGVEQLPVPYYRTKVQAERVIRESGVPYSILRATQFHYFVAMLLSGLARMPLFLPIPKGFNVQPVATEDVAVRLARSLADEPRGLLKDFCGPEILSLTEAATLWKEARGSKKPILPLPIYGKLGAAFRNGYNTNPAGELGAIRFTEWLAREYAPAKENQYAEKNQQILNAS